MVKLLRWYPQQLAASNSNPSEAATHSARTFQNQGKTWFDRVQLPHLSHGGTPYHKHSRHKVILKGTYLCWKHAKTGIGNANAISFSLLCLYLNPGKPSFPPVSSRTFTFGTIAFQNLSLPEPGLCPRCGLPLCCGQLRSGPNLAIPSQI